MSQQRARPLDAGGTGPPQVPLQLPWRRSGPLGVFAGELGPASTVIATQLAAMLTWPLSDDQPRSSARASLRASPTWSVHALNVQPDKAAVLSPFGMGHVAVSKPRCRSFCQALIPTMGYAGSSSVSMFRPP